jgi:methylenetetrahydrofolate reductase (NADPH)
MQMSRLKEKLNNGRFVFTGEIAPPKGTNIEKHLESADLIKDKVDAVNVTDLQSAVLRAGSLATCHLLQKRGVEPVYQLTCRDRNRLALQSDLLSAWILGIENVLCLTGDHTALGDHPQAKPVFDFDSVQLLKASSILNSGKDLTGHVLDGSPNFFQGAVVSPGADPIEPQMIKMKKKVEAGAKFFQTQAVFDAGQFDEFVNKVNGLQVPIIAGIVILKSAGMAGYMNEKVAGIHVPENIIKEMKNTEKSDAKKKAVEIASRLIRQIKPFCQGIHLMTLGWEELIPDIIVQAELD